MSSGTVRFSRCVLMLFLGFGSLVESHGGPTVALDVAGRAELELTSRYRRSAFDKRVVLDFAVGKGSPVRAAADVELSHEAGDGRLRELQVEFDLGPGWVSVGQQKKRFGLDSDYGAKSRMSLGRGMFYKKLASYSYVGRDSSVEFRTTPAAESRWKHRLSVHSSEGMNHAALFETRYALTGDFSVIGYSLYQMSSLARQWRHTKGQVLAFQWEGASHRFEAELMVAGDPWETAYLESVREDREVYFGGVSLAPAFYFGKATVFIKAALLRHDLRNPHDSTLELTPGIKFGTPAGLQLGGEFCFLKSSSSRAQKRPLPFDASTSLRIMARYFF